MSERKKTKRSKHINYVSLAKVVEMAAEVIKENPDMDYSDFHFEKEYDYGDSTYIILEYETPETDTEMKERIKREEIQAERNREWELKQFKALKKKYGDKS